MVKTETGCCVLCQVSVPCRGSHHIFSKKVLEGDNVADVLARILEIPVEPDAIHSEYICLNCELVCLEFAGIETRMLKIKEEVIESYNKFVSSIEYVEVETKEDENEDIFAEYEETAEEAPRMTSAETIESDSIITVVSGEENDEAEAHEMEIGESAELLFAAEASEEAPKKVYTRKHNVFHCNLCPDERVISDPTELTLHMKIEHNEKLYLCDICGKDCGRRMYLMRHLESHSNAKLGEDATLMCGSDESEGAADEDQGQRRQGQAAAGKAWLCTLCDKPYGSKNLLEEHMNMHTGDRPYKCAECPKDFASKYTLAAHERIHTARPRPYSCLVCGKKFLTGQNLAHHEKTHLGVKEYKCDVCGKAFGSSHNLRVHKIVHSGNKPFLCRTCGKSFARRAEVRDHERIHTGEKPFQCDICSMCFAQRSNLQSHKRATHLNEKRYKCDMCDKNFKRRRLLDYHIQAVHTGERPFKCTVCPSSFVYPEHYKKHLLIHSNEKKYTCEVCGKGFNNQDNRNTHRFVHSDKKPFECVQCGQGFMRKPLLFAHMKSESHLSDTIIVNQPRLLESGGKASGGQDADGDQEAQVESTTYILGAEADDNLQTSADDVAIEQQEDESDSKDVQILQIAIQSQQEKTSWM
ncbi:zinc finger protein ZFP2-like [Phlebotomus argentipes]|uniref:zinc finger protein ZFP2-like n=1 Tax=Phlebotomus argentipes TaxID=94469 RepID=UPI0028931A3E|nr:zinc finger protein ZFP2-like [Phlebotomus argentipes]